MKQTLFLTTDCDNGQKKEGMMWECCGNLIYIYLARDAVAPFEHQRSHSAQPIELKYRVSQKSLVFV